MLKRNYYSVRAKTHVATNVELEMSFIMTVRNFILIHIYDFLDFVQLFRELSFDFEVPMDFIINMDETAVYFVPDIKNTIEKTGTKQITIKQTGNSTQRCSVLLASSMTGLKLPPLVVFVGKPSGRIIREFKDYDPRYFF